MSITAPAGFSAAGVAAGLKSTGAKDVALVVNQGPTFDSATVFTANRCQANPILWSKEVVKDGTVRAVVINSGGANCYTGAEGFQTTHATAERVADHLGIGAIDVVVCSTGLIGMLNDRDDLLAGVDAAAAALSAEGGTDAAEAIMTTDSVSKQVVVEGAGWSIGGMAKGAGMIEPNMATMLGFIATDARIAPELLQTLASELGEKSFNRITIDGDTSTNDACMLMASGQYSGPEITASSPALPKLREALQKVYLELAHAIVRDGEGATKFVTIDVSGAASQQEALDVAYTVAHSPLVKTALFASDPNWGRILAAVGRAGVDGLDLEALEIYLGDVCLVRNGGRADDYSEARGQAVMDREEITIAIDLMRGEVRETVWTCDFSHDYVTINAEYRT